MPSLHPCTAQKLSSCASAPELIPLPVPSPPIRRPPTLPTNPRHNNLLEESRWRNNNIRPPADWRPPPSSRFRNAHVSLDVKYDGTWRGNDERWVTGRDAETSPNPWPHRRRDMPPEALRHSAPNGPNRTSVVSADGLLPDQSPDPERSPPVKPCAHRNPCNCAVLRARLGVPETPAPVSPPSPSPTPPTEDGSASASTRSHQPIEPVKRTSLVAARLEVARARDNLAQERRRWLPASHAPPQTAALTSDLAESSPREPTTGPAVASDAPTVADPSSASRPSPAGFSLHRTTRMIPGEMHVRAAEASLANAMLRLVDLQSTARGHDLESTVRDTSDLVSTASTPVNDEEARPAASDSDLHARSPSPDRPSLIARGCVLPTGCLTKPTGPAIANHNRGQLAGQRSATAPRPTLLPSVPVIPPPRPLPLSTATPRGTRRYPLMTPRSPPALYHRLPSPAITDVTPTFSGSTSTQSANRRPPSSFRRSRPTTPTQSWSDCSPACSAFPAQSAGAKVLPRLGFRQTPQPRVRRPTPTTDRAPSPNSQVQQTRERHAPRHKFSYGLRPTPTQAWPPTARLRQRNLLASTRRATRPPRQVSHCRMRLPLPFPTPTWERVRMSRA